MQGQWRWFRFGVIVLAAMAVPVAAGCQNDGGINAGVGGQGPGGGGSSAAAGGGAGARGGAGSSAAADGGVTPTDGGGPGGWVDLSPCHFPSTIPPGYRTDPMTTFDPDRGKLVVYGGHDGYSDVWDVDVATGLRTDRTTCAQVGVIPKADGVLVYDAGRKRVVLFSGAAAGDVREWDPVVNVWTDRPPPSTSPGAVPTGRPRAAVFDATRGRAIVFIVDFAAQSLALSVWEWNGVTGAWTLRQASLPVTYPLGVPSLAFDAGRGVVWGFGGADALGTQIDRLWTWNVTTAEFVDLTPAARPVAWPPGRAGAGLAYDATRGKLVLYGGWVGAVTRRDLWEWDAAAAIWVNRTPADVSATGATLPPGVLWPLPDVWSSDHVFADPAHGRVVLLHVVDLQSTGHSGAWLWNGERGTWSEATADTPPAAWPMSVSSPATAWDDDDRALFLSRNGELWRWTPADDRWEVLAWHEGMGAPNSLPAWLDGAAIAYDAKARKVVLFGGTVFGTVTTPSVLTDDLWLWDPATARLSKVSRPPGAAWPEPRREHALAYDPVRQRLLLFGGGKPEASRELWELDTATTTWRDLSGAAAGAAWPEARMGHALVLDPERRVLVLRGGGSTSPGTPFTAFGSTWELTAGTSSWSERAAASSSAPMVAPLAFVGGVGLLTLTFPMDGNSERELWRWDGAAAAWTSLGVDLPAALTAPGYVDGLVGAGDRLLLLWQTPQDATLPTQEQLFYHLWQWRPTP